MKFRFMFGLIILSLFFSVKVNAQSFNMTLNTTKTEVVKGEQVEIFVTIDNLYDIPEGLNACSFNLDYDTSKIEVIKNNEKSLIGQNGWDGEEELDIIWDSSNPAKSKTIIGKINAKILDDGSITIKNITCSDSINDITSKSSTLIFSTKEAQNNNNNNNNENNNNNQNNNTNDDYNSSDTVEPSKTGIKEVAIIFLLIAFTSLFIIKFISKKNLFKKI